MQDDNAGFKAMLMFAFFVLFVMVPLLAPPAFIALGAIGWPIAYLVIWIKASGFDPVNSVPWVTVTYIDTPTALVVTFLLSLVGLIRGVAGAAAMAIVWGPALFLPMYLLNLGVAVDRDCIRPSFDKRDYCAKQKNVPNKTGRAAPVDSIDAAIEDLTKDVERILREIKNKR